MSGGLKEGTTERDSKKKSANLINPALIYPLEENVGTSGGRWARGERGVLIFMHGRSRTKYDHLLRREGEQGGYGYMCKSTFHIQFCHAPPSQTL